MKISVIMSVYNAGEYLLKSVDSILKQTYGDYEFIIVNDGGMSFSFPNDRRVRIIQNKKNIGLTKSLNIALREARGEYIARMDADDISHPERFAEQVKYLDEHPECVLVGTWAEIIDEDGKVVRVVKHPCSNEVIQRELIKYNPFFHSSIMFRRGWYYNETFKYAQDYELYFRISREWDNSFKELANIPKLLHQYRENKNSITVKKNKEQIACVIRAKVRAFKHNNYHLVDLIYLVKTCMTWLLPTSIKRKIKNIIYNLRKAK